MTITDSSGNAKTTTIEQGDRIIFRTDHHVVQVFTAARDRKTWRIFNDKYPFEVRSLNEALEFASLIAEILGLHAEFTEQTRIGISFTFKTSDKLRPIGIQAGDCILFSRVGERVVRILTKENAFRYWSSGDQKKVFSACLHSQMYGCAAILADTIGLNLEPAGEAPGCTAYRFTKRIRRIHEDTPPDHRGFRPFVEYKDEARGITVIARDEKTARMLMMLSHGG